MSLSVNVLEWEKDTGSNQLFIVFGLVYPRWKSIFGFNEFYINDFLVSLSNLLNVYFLCTLASFNFFFLHLLISKKVNSISRIIPNSTQITLSHLLTQRKHLNHLKKYTKIKNEKEKERKKKIKHYLISYQLLPPSLWRHRERVTSSWKKVTSSFVSLPWAVESETWRLCGPLDVLMELSCPCKYHKYAHTYTQIYANLHTCTLSLTQ